jgi:hypothetical protein
LRRLPLLVLVLLAPFTARTQGAYFYSHVTQQASKASATNVVTTPSATTIAFCNAPVSVVPCTNKAMTYTDATPAMACPTSTQIVLAGTNSCVGFPDAQNNWGVWASQGQYAYIVTVGCVNFGPYYITLTSDTVISPGVFTNTQMNLYLHVPVEGSSKPAIQTSDRIGLASFRRTWMPSYE